MSCYSQNFDDREDLERERFSENINHQRQSEIYMRPQADCYGNLPKEEKKCLLPGCNKMTTHNGGYCCADHCREHRRIRKVNATAQRGFVEADGCDLTKETGD